MKKRWVVSAVLASVLAAPLLLGAYDAQPFTVEATTAPPASPPLFGDPTKLSF